MFDFVHENKKLVQIVMALITLPFALWGISSYDKARNTVDVIATVNGIKITQQELENTLRQQQERMRQQLGANFDPTVFDNPEVRRTVLDNLVSQHLLVERSKAAGLVVPDEQVAQQISGIDAFQDDGKFDKSRYERVLKNQGMTPLMFEAKVREDLLGQELRDIYDLNGFASNDIVDKIIRLNEQQRIVAIAPISYQSYLSQAKVDDSAIKNYYEKNQNEFQVKEQAKVEYVKFSEENLISKVPASVEDARKYYEEHQSEFGTPEERQAAHILITIKPGASQSEQEAAKTKAEALLLQVTKNPERFAELAKSNSQDPGSAEKGGDLGFFGRGMMVKPFEDAVFALKVGQVSGLVRSDFGYHIIKLLAVKPSRIRPFDEVREGIINKIRQLKAADMFAELADKFSNTVYEQSDTLKPAADLVGGKIERSTWLIKGETAPEPWTAKMLQAIFNDEVLKNKRNTAAIEVAANTLVAARLLEYKPASVRTLNEVQDQIRQKLSRQQALELATIQGKSILSQLLAGGKSTLKWEADQTVTRAKHGTIDAGLIRQVFQAKAAKLPQFVGAEDPQNGYVIVRIDAVKDIDAIDDAKRTRYAQQLRQMSGEEMFNDYMSAAMQQAKIKLNLPETKPQP